MFYLIFICLFFIVNVDDRELNMVFNIKLNEVEEDGENEVFQVFVEIVEFDNFDGGIVSKLNKNFFLSINWQEDDVKLIVNYDDFFDSDDEFENLRNKDYINIVKSIFQIFDFFFEREGIGNNTEEDLDLFNLKLLLNGEFSEDLFNFKFGDDFNGYLFNLEDDFDFDESVFVEYSSYFLNNVDFFNLGI